MSASQEPTNQPTGISNSGVHSGVHSSVHNGMASGVSKGILTLGINPSRLDFKHNDFKSFKFTIEQYVQLEIEYSRYIIYKELIKNIESLLKLNDTDPSNSNGRKLYENKNILDRFILECINYGISPIIDTFKPSEISKSIITINVNLESIEDVDMEKLKHYIFFNDCMTSGEKLRNTVYYRKMLNEYIEKKIKIMPDKLSRLEGLFLEAQRQFAMKIACINQIKMKPNGFNDVICSIGLTESDNFIVRYRTYTKTINFARYARLVKNYDRPFPYDIIRMILRYGIFDMSNQQWSIGINLYDMISEIYEISFEMFASPLNFNMPMFCSIFLDTDKVFGSVGSFYNLGINKLLNQNIKGVFFNPPYLPILMNHTTKLCINILAEMEKQNIEFSVVSFLPNWIDADYIQQFLHSKYTMIYKTMNKGDFVLHEKDKGKIIKGTFELLVILMNSKKQTMDLERSEYMKTSFKNIIAHMKEETRIGQIDK